MTLVEVDRLLVFAPNLGYEIRGDMVLGTEPARVADNFSPSDTQSGGLFPHKSSVPFFLLRGRRLSDARTKCCLSTRVWLLALRLLVGA